MLQLDEQSGNWRVETDVSVSHTDYYEELDVKLVPLTDDPSQEIAKCTQRLISTYNKGEDFRREIERLFVEATKGPKDGWIGP